VFFRVFERFWPCFAWFLAGWDGALFLFHESCIGKENSMSHVVRIETEVRDAGAVRLACERLKLPPPVVGTFRLFSGSATGLGVELPGWRYPVVCELASARLTFDNYGGRWGERRELDRFLQGYAVERAKLEARRRGHTVTEQPLEDGSIRLTVRVGGEA
jgi:hypothetical protein